MRGQDAGVLAEGRGEAEFRHEGAKSAVPFAVGIGEERGLDAQLRPDPPPCPLEVGPVLAIVVLPHLPVGRAVIADGDSRRDEPAELVPAHDACVTLIDRIGGDEHGERQARLLQTGPRFFEGRARGVIDGDADGALRQRPALIEGGQDFGHRKHGIAAAREVVDMRLELGDRDARRRVRVLAEPVILQDDGGIGGECRSAARRDADGHGESGARGADAAEAPAHDHGAINPVPAALSQSRG